MALFSLFFHLLAKPGQAGLFGFRWMSSFLNALGLFLCVLSMGLLGLYYAKNSKSDYKAYFVFMSKSIVLLGVYYGFYTFLPISDYSNIVYYSMIGLYAIVLRFVIFKLNTAILRSKTEDNLKHKVKRLINFLFEIRNNHYKKVARKAIAAEEQAAPIDGVPVIEQIDEFDNKLWEKLQETTNE